LWLRFVGLEQPSRSADKRAVPGLGWRRRNIHGLIFVDIGVSLAAVREVD
jgi:hypothetical protein